MTLRETVLERFDREFRGVIRETCSIQQSTWDELLEILARAEMCLTTVTDGHRRADLTRLIDDARIERRRQLRQQSDPNASRTRHGRPSSVPSGPVPGGFLGSHQGSRQSREIHPRLRANLGTAAG